MSLALALTLFRLALAPLVIVLGWRGAPGWTVGIALAAGLVSDVLDGVVARRTGTATATLRRLDSTVDTIFYIAIAVAAWELFPEELRPRWRWVALIVATELATNLYSWLRFGREASYHSRSAKLFGLCLFAALFVLFLGGSGRLLLPAIVVGLLSHAENLAITATLPEWRHDVPSLAAARRIRRAAAPR